MFHGGTKTSFRNFRKHKCPELSYAYALVMWICEGSPYAPRFIKEVDDKPTKVEAAVEVPAEYKAMLLA